MEILIGAILDAVFASLAESIGLSDRLRELVGRNPEKLAFRTALTKALTDAGQQFPGRDLRYFAEMMRNFGGPLLARSLQPTSPLITAAELTEAWLGHLNLDSVVYYRADFERFAKLFLASLYNHLENQQPLQWIAHLRSQKISAAATQRSAEAAEQSAALLAALRADLQQLNERLEQQSQINTGGGVAIGGGVTARHDFVGRDQITIRNYFTSGLACLHIDYSAQIEEFLQEYLGSRRKRVPFGGRAAQLAELDTWLHDRDAPPYYLMTAEAGRGKSTLVCRWQVQLLTQPDVAVIFIPISIRFETATQDVVYAALAARLADAHGETMQAAALSADQWRATCQSYLRRQPPNGKQLLVILDGLDEATGWAPGRSLFPGDPPEGLRVLVTARQRAGEIGPHSWATTLGWDDEQLACKRMLTGLDRVGVQEALASMGNPLELLATQVDVVGELYRLTAGDPLLVRLYVDALVDKGKTVAYLRAEDLTSITPGLQGYFDRWWDEQHQQWKSEDRDPLVEQEKLLMLLNAVAAALGPLTHSDLAAVCDLTNGVLVRRLAQSVGRWLIGDGRSQGYTFSHPRLGYYFWEQLGTDEQSAWNERFIQWGAATVEALNSGRLAVKVAPRYLIQHYTAHLERSTAPATSYYALISDGWCKAWEEVDVSYSGFLNDVARAQAQAQKAYHPAKHDRAEALVQELKGALCRASVSALGNNLTPDLLRLAIIHNLRTPTQVVAIIQLMPESRQQAQALAVLMPYFPKEMLGEVVAVSSTIRDDYSRAAALGTLAPHLPPALLEEALAAARAIGNDYSRAAALGALAPHLSEAQQHQVLREALAASSTIGDDYLRGEALGALAPHLPPTLLVEALAAARAIESDYSRAAALGALVPHIPIVHQREVLKEALATARSLGHGISRAIALGELAPHLPPALLEEALDAARAIGDDYFNINVLGTLVPYLPPDLIEEALAGVRVLKDGYSRVAVLGVLAPHLPEAQQAGVLGEALAAARAIENGYSRADALGKLAPHLPPALLEEALAAARTIGDETARANALRALASHLSPAQLEKALAAAGAIENDATRADALGVLALYLPKAQQREVLEEALTAAKGIGDDYFRADALGALVPHLPPTLLGEALAAASAIGNDAARSIALGALVPHLSPTLLVEALAEARGINDDYFRAAALRALAPHLSPALREEALAAASVIPNYAAPTDALGVPAPHLPPTLLGEALAAVSVIPNYAAPTDALGVPAPHLLPALLGDALVAARAFSPSADALRALAPHLSPALLEEALAAVNTSSDGSFRVKVLDALAPYLPPTLLEEALAIAKASRNDAIRADALRALAPHLPPALLGEALAVARAIDDDADRAKTLCALAPRLPEAQQYKVLGEALTAVSRASVDADDRVETLRRLTPHLTLWGRVVPEIMYLPYSNALQRLSLRQRPVFLRELVVLLPFILSLAGDEAPQAAAGIFHALSDVCTWWP